MRPLYMHSLFSRHYLMHESFGTYNRTVPGAMASYGLNKNLMLQQVLQPCTGNGLGVDRFE